MDSVPPGLVEKVAFQAVRPCGHLLTSPIPSAQEQGLLKGSKDLADKKPELLVLLHQGSEHCSLHHNQAAHTCESNSMGSNRLFWTPLALTHKCTFKYTNNFLIFKTNEQKGGIPLYCSPTCRNGT
ncbi:hypothetical protein ACRRTK_007069 [Alexandromys fortis]